MEEPVVDVVASRTLEKGMLAGFTVAVSHRCKHNGEWQLGINR